MCPPTDKSHVEAWKSLIDLSKTTISIASMVLTALIGFYVLNQSKFDVSNINYVAPILLVLSILSAIYGFGKAIRVIKTGTSETSGVIFINISVVLLVAGILFISLIEFNKNEPLNVVLENITKETKTFETELSPKFIKKLVLIDSNYLITYDIDGEIKKITYSLKENKIVSIE